MDITHIKEKIYEKYILPTERDREFFIGVEIEMPIVNLSGHAVDFSTAWSAAQKFADRYGFTADKWDSNGVFYSATNKTNGDNLSFDCSYNNMELSLGKAKRIQELEDRFNEYIYFLNHVLLKDGHILTGMGINPNYKVNRKDFIPTGRYRMLERFLQCAGKWDIPMYFHHHPDFASYASASQIQLDVKKEKLIPTLKAFSLAEPVKSVIFNNSVMADDKNLLCARDGFWENSTHGINPHNIGMYTHELKSVDDLLEYICTTSIFCAERMGRYIHFKPVIITKYLQMDRIEGEYYRNGAYHSIVFKPQLSDLQYLRSYKFEDLTYRGTIEFRSVCNQPFSDAMTVAAFHTGLMDAPERLIELLERDHTLYHHGYSATELRKLMNYASFPEFVDEDNLRTLCTSVLDLAREGLVKRGYGEENYLDPLYVRAEKLCSPGRAMVEALDKGTAMNKIVEKYAAITNAPAKPMPDYERTRPRYAAVL